MRPPARPARSVAAIVALALLAAGCGDGGGDGDAATAGSTTSTTAATAPEEVEPAEGDEAAGEVAPTDVELLDAGTGPRQALRLALEVGATQSGALELRTQQRQEVDGELGPALPVPVIRSVVRLEVVDAADDRFTLAYGYESFEVTNPEELGAETAADVERAIEGFQGVTGTSVIDGRGATLEGTVDVPDGFDDLLADQVDQLSKSVEQLSPPFPAEEVGVGARWRAVREITVQGLTTRHETTYTLVSRDGDDYVLEVEMAQTAEPQALELPDTPDATLELLAFDVSGSGRVEGSVARALPRASNADSAGTVTFRFTEPDGAGGTTEGELVQHQQVTMALTDAG